MTNNTSDITPPAFSRATIDGTTLMIRYDEDLKSSPLPAATDYTVIVAGSSLTPSMVSISGKVVTLTLAAADAPGCGDTVVVVYTKGTNPVGDTAGNDAADIAGRTVDNLTHSAGQITFVGNLGQREFLPQTIGYSDSLVRRLAQKLTTASAQSGYSLEAVNIEVVDAGSTASPLITVAEADGIDLGSTLYTLLAPASFGNGNQTFTAPNDATLDPETQYFVVVANHNIADSGTARFSVQTTFRDEEDVGGLTGWNIANVGRTTGTLGWLSEASLKVLLSGLVKADVTAPTLATTNGATIDGTSLVLTYNEALNGGSDPATSAYTVNVNSSPVTVSSVDVDGMTVAITLATAVPATDTVKVTYAAPSSNPVEDAVGNDAAALTDQSATNISRPPAFVRATIDGRSLMIRYDENLKASPLPAATDYTVAVVGSGVTPSNVAIYGPRLRLTLAAADGPAAGIRSPCRTRRARTRLRTRRETMWPTLRLRPPRTSPTPLTRSRS